jgi:hypothetical protein
MDENSKESEDEAQEDYESTLTHKPRAKLGGGMGLRGTLLGHAKKME